MIHALVGRPASPAVGYQMINSVTIENFRGFDVAKLDGCRRINVIVGENGSGKTALLEGIFLAAGPAEIALRLRGWRGIESGQGSATHEQLVHALWGDLFHNFQMDKPARIALTGSEGHTRAITIRHREHAKSVPLSAKSEAAEGSLPIEFRYKMPKRPEFTVSPELTESAIKFPPSPSQIEASFYPANRAPSATEAANRFSFLSRQLRKQEFIDLFTAHFPEVIDLSVESLVGTAALYAHVATVNEKLPIGLASNGMAKLAAILLAIPNQPAGVVLVDEIETGFYYQRMPKVWESLLSFAKKYDSQIFASTHSAECLLAAAQVADRNPDDFCVIRTVREHGASQIRQFSGNKFVDAVNEHIEVR